MGFHDQFHRRSKHNRLANDKHVDEEEENVKQLFERFSPTAIYSETLTFDDPEPTGKQQLNRVFF
jgi:CRISPR/Cas system-associated protein Cas7 (RAMP superfamily)